MKQNLLFILLSFLSLISIGQTTQKWEKVFFKDIDASADDVIEAYDGGYLITGWYTGSFPKYCWIIKTDINGNMLWQKDFMNENEKTFVILRIQQDCKGNIYLAGSRHDTNTKDPYIMKLNPCGEKLWCRVFHNPDNHADFISELKLLPDGDPVMTIRYHNGPMDQRITLARLNAEGNLEYKVSFGKKNDRIFNEDDTNIALLPNNQILVTGYGSYRGDEGRRKKKAYYICTNEDGEILWEKVLNKDIFGIGGSSHEGYCSIVSKDQKHIYSSLRRPFYENNSEVRTSLLKMDINGETIDIYDVNSGYEFSFMENMVFASDSTIIGSLIYARAIEQDDAMVRYQKPESSKIKTTIKDIREDGNPEGAALFDTLGQIKKEMTIHNGYSSRVIRTSDNHFLFFTFSHPTIEENPSAYLYKFDSDLNWAKVDNCPMEYDNLCDHPIKHDTVKLDNCGIFVGIEEDPQRSETTQFKVYPNPTTDILNIQLPEYIQNKSENDLYNITHQNYDYKQNASIQVVSIQGKVIYHQNLNAIPNYKLSTSQFKQGMYLLRLLYNGKTMQTTKFVVGGI
ncbi:MAG: T9SS type A sorting domain-containing protein [Hyphomicrobiales bacterium]